MAKATRSVAEKSQGPARAAGRSKVPETPKAKAPVPQQDSAFSSLWDRFQSEANFNAGAHELEATAVREELARLEEKVAEKRAELDGISRREQVARDKMQALLKAGFSPDAILSAMKVEFRARKASGRTKEKDLVEVTDDLKTALLDVLDREGQPLAEIVKASGRDAKEVQRALTALVREGKAATQGERRAKVFMIV